MRASRPNSVPVLQTPAGRGIVLGETNRVEPFLKDDDKVARRRFQSPEPIKSGNFWYLLIREDAIENGRRVRKRKRVKLAPATMGEREVRKIAAEVLRPQNQGLITSGSAVTFGEFVENVYRPTLMSTFASSTQHRYDSAIKVHLKPIFETSCLRDLTAMTIQRYLSGLGASELSHESIDKVRDVLASILGAAVQYQYLVTNPVEGLRLPRPKRGRPKKRFIEPQQFMKLVQLIQEPYATMVYVSVFTALRVSELIGLKWGDIHADSLTVDERYCRGDWGAPKSEASNATIPVNAEVLTRS